MTGSQWTSCATRNRVRSVEPELAQRWGAHEKKQRSRWHVATFYTDTLNELVRTGAGRSITTQVIRCPGAWGYGAIPHLLRVARWHLRNDALSQEPKQLIYTIDSAVYERYWTSGPGEQRSL